MKIQLSVPLDIEFVTFILLGWNLKHIEIINSNLHMLRM